MGRGPRRLRADERPPLTVYCGLAGWYGSGVGFQAIHAPCGPVRPRLVTLGVPRSIQPIVATLCPCATSIPLPETSSGQLDPVAARFVASQSMALLSHHTLEPSVCYDHAKTAAKFGAPLYYAHRVDLHEALKGLATTPHGPGAPADVVLAAEVVAYVSSTRSWTCV